MSTTWASPEDIAFAHCQQTERAMEAYYDAGRGCYWILNDRQNWIQVNESSLKRHLKARGLSSKTREGEYISDIDKQLVHVQQRYDLAYAGPLAGYAKGLVEAAESRILVTTGPRIIEPKKGNCALIHELLKNLFWEEGQDQRPYLLGWLKVACECLQAGARRPGQVLCLAGPAACGKSLLQNLITEMLGGRVAKPYRYMSGVTPFNSELFGAEHLMIEDEVATHRTDKRREFGARIKDLTVNEVQSCHAKGRDAISLKPFWRVTLSVNDEPENLMILPPFDESISDKLILLKAFRRGMPMPTDTDAQRREFWGKLTAELPAFLSFLSEWTIPMELRSDRFGVTAFHHPDLLSAINALAPEIQLLSLIDLGFNSGSFSEPGKWEPWEGTAEDLQSRLTAHQLFSYEARQLLSWSGATGNYLARLASKFPNRVKKARTATSRLWLVMPPESKS